MKMRTIHVYVYIFYYCHEIESTTEKNYGTKNSYDFQAQDKLEIFILKINMQRPGTTEKLS